jgi:hypothetical protein
MIRWAIEDFSFRILVWSACGYAEFSQWNCCLAASALIQIEIKDQGELYHSRSKSILSRAFRVAQPPTRSPSPFKKPCSSPSCSAVLPQTYRFLNHNGFYVNRGLLRLCSCFVHGRCPLNRGAKLPLQEQCQRSLVQWDFKNTRRSFDQRYFIDKRELLNQKTIDVSRMLKDFMDSDDWHHLSNN